MRLDAERGADREHLEEEGQRALLGVRELGRDLVANELGVRLEVLAKQTVAGARRVGRVGAHPELLLVLPRVQSSQLPAMHDGMWAGMDLRWEVTLRGEGDQ